jgi:hypothetical protein
MERLIFTSATGEIIRFDGPPFYLSKVDGLGDVDVAIELQKSPYQDGSTVVGSVLEERMITLEFLIVQDAGYKDVSSARIQIAKAFNPKLGPGTLRYENDYLVREIKAIADSVPSYPDERRTETIQKGFITLLCPNPYWLADEKIDQLVVWEGGLEFPLQLPTYFAQQSESKAKKLLNEGDVETPVEITFNGPATAPIRVINKTTGDFIEVNQSLLVGERLEINTAFGQKRVTKLLADGTKFNAFHFLNLDSSFFQLIPGNNLIDYSTGADYERAGVTITWHNRYLSV